MTSSSTSTSTPSRRRAAMGVGMVCVLAACGTLLLAKTATAQSRMQMEQRQLTNKDPQKYKFVFEACKGTRGEECQAWVENEMKHNVLGQKGIALETSIQTTRSDFGSEARDIYIQVNSKGQVMGGGSHSKQGPAAHSEETKYDGHAGFHEAGHKYYQDCKGLMYMQCCRNVQRMYLRLSKLQDNETMVRAGEQINGQNMNILDTHCVMELVSPLAEIYEEGPLGNSIAFTEYVMEEESHDFELTYVDASEVTMSMQIKVSPDDGLVHEAPYVNARMALNPAQEFLTSYFAHNEDSTLTSQQMNLMGTDGSSTFFPATVGETWWYSVPMGISIVTACSCCFFLVFMCCIPVKDPDDMSLQDDGSASSDPDYPHKASVYGGNTQGMQNHHDHYDFDNEKYVE